MASSAGGAAGRAVQSDGVDGAEEGFLAGDVCMES